MTTKGLRYRRKGHKHQVTAGNTSYFSKAVRKHGIDAFDFSILEVCSDQKTCLARERELIAEHKPEYNTAAGGLSGPQGWKHSEESRRKMSESHIGKIGPWRGKKRSPESMAKMVATRAAKGIKPMLGKRHSAETIARIKATRPFLPKPRPFTPEERAEKVALCRRNIELISRPVVCSNDGKAFRNPNEAAKYYDVASSALRRWLDGVNESKRGLKFEYVE